MARDWVYKCLYGISLLILGAILITNLIGQWITVVGSHEAFIWKPTNIWTILSIFLALGLFLIGFQIIYRLKTPPQTLFRIVIGIIAAISIISIPLLNADNTHLHDIASISWSANNTNHPNVFGPYSYMAQHGNQFGLFTIFVPLQNIFDDWQLAFKLLNIIALLITIRYLYKITKHLSNTKTAQILLYITLLFSPLWLIINLVYNDMLALAAITAAFYQALVFVKKPTAKHLAFVCILSTLAIIIRQNSLVFVLAIIIYALFAPNKILLRQRLCIPITIIASTAIGYFGIPLFWQTALQKPLDHTTSMPSSSYIAMGMMEPNPKVIDLAGWWNGYNRLCNQTPSCNERSISIIEDRTKFFAANPTKAVEFYTEKISSQWAQPTFQMPNYGILPNRSIVHTVEVVHNIYARGLYIILIAAAIVGIFIERRKMAKGAALLVLAFIGYFLFSILWEAKSRYVLPAIILILPLSAIGLSLAWNRLSAKLKSRKSSAAS